MDIDERIGRQVRAMSLKWRATSLVVAGTGVDQVHRILILVDHQPNGAAPGITDVLTSASALAQLNPANRLRFKILLDKTIYLNASGEAASGRSWQFSPSLGFEVLFNAGVAGTVADITTNSLYCVVIGNIAAGSTAGKLEYNAAFQFRDS